MMKKLSTDHDGPQPVNGAAINGTEQPYLNLLLQSPFAVAIYQGENMVIALANDAMKRALGKGPAIEQRPLLEVLPELRDTAFPGLLHDVYTSGQPFVGSEMLVRLEHEGRLHEAYFNFVYQPYRELDGTIAGVTCIGYEVTDQVMANRRVAASEANVRRLFAQAPVAICILRGPAHTVEMANPRMLGLWDRSADAVLNRPVFEALPEVPGQGFEPLLDSVLHTGRPFRADAVPARLERAGELQKAYFDLTFEPLHEVDGRVSGIMVVANEVTDQVISRQQLEDSERRFRQVFDQVPFAVMIYRGPELRIDLANPPTLALLGKSWDELSQRPVTDVYPELAAAGRFEPHRRVLETGKSIVIPEHPLTIVHQGQARSGWYHTVYDPLRDADGRVVGVISVGSDVTEQVEARRRIEESERRYRELSDTLEQLVHERTVALTKANEQLQRQNAALEKSNRDLEQFAHIASHDLQEPLRKIRMFASLLQHKGADAAEREKYTGKIEESAERMTQLIESVLNYARMSDAGDLVQPTDLNGVLAGILDDFELQLSEKGARVELGALPVVQGIPLHLSQLFSNLLSNALKFSGPDPLIRIGAALLPPGAPDRHPRLDPARAYHHIYVEDNGIGFSPEYAERIFAIFQRLHDRQRYAGTGIGLALCKRIVENHGGVITATGTPGQGARFDVYWVAGAGK